MNTENELNFFTNRPPFELIDNEEMRMAQDERIVTQTIGPRTTHTEISRILQQKIYMERENLEKFSLGILNILLNTDNPGKFQQFFQSLQFLTQDGFESTILKLESIVYLKFQSLKIESATNLLKIVHNFIKLRLPKVDTLIMLCLRQVVIEDFSEKMQQYTRLFLSILTEESDWFISNFNNANIALVFAKLLRIFSFALCAEISAYKTMILKLLNSIWVTKKEACLMLGRELIRIMMDIFKAKEIEFITNDLKNSHPSLDIPLSEYLLKNKGEVLSLPDITKMMIPPYLEELLRYLHYYTPTENMPRMMKWIIRDFRIQSGIMNEFLMVDITRFLVASVHPDSNTIRSGFAPRWKTIAFMLQVAKNDLARSFIKQNIFYDWIFYNPKETNIMLIEPGISIIKGTYYENLPLCHELLDFLFISCKEYNPKNAVETKASIRAAFGEGIRQGVTETFDDLMYSEALDYSLREKMTTFIPSEKNYEAGLTGLADFQESQPTSTLNHVPDNTFKPESIEEEYDPFEEFSPSKFDENMFKNIGLHEYDPDSSATGVLNSDTGIGGMEVESVADKPVESQSFNEKFKAMIQKMTENPDKANFEKFLKEFIHYVQSGQGDEDKYLKFAETLSNCYDDHFEDVLFTIDHNIIKILLQHVIETLHTVVATYNLLKHILRGLYKIRSTVSFQYLIFYYRIVQSTERAFLEDYIILIGGERNFEPQLSEDISRLYAIYSQAEFNELLIKILKDFCNYIIGRPPLLKTIIEIGDVSLNFWLEEELTCCTLRLFPDKIKELVLNSTRWSVSSQESFWGLLTNQYNLSRKKEASDLIVDIRDVVNELCKDPDFDKNSVYGILKGFRRFFNDTLQNKDDKTKLDYMVLMIDLNQNVSFFLHSLFNLWDPHLIRVSLKEYAKRNGEEPEKIRNLGYHMLYMRSKRYYLKNQESIMETHLKSVLTRLFQKHKLEKEFKDIIED